MERDLLSELTRIYAQEPIKTDLFGRRDALPSEIEKVINPKDFADLVDTHLPTERDVYLKGDL
jgi:hypothetical protein